MSLHQIPVDFHTQYLDMQFYPLQLLYIVIKTVNWSSIFGKICFKNGKTISDLKVEDTCFLFMKGSIIKKNSNSNSFEGSF